MAMSRKDEARFLDKDEAGLVEKSHHPEIASLEDKALGDTIKLIRERRDRAREIGQRQRREMRGKAKPQGAKAAGDNAGTKQKMAVLAAALKRLNAEQTRRREQSARNATASGMKRAMELKAASAAPKRPSSKTADKGMKSVPNKKNEQITDPREVGRVSQQIKKAQAKRDK